MTGPSAARPSATSRVGAGDARLGDSRAVAVQALRALGPGGTEVGVQQPGEYGLSFENGGTVQAWFDEADQLEAIELWGSQEWPVSVNGVEVTGLPIEQALAPLPAEFIPLNESWISRALDVGLTVHEGIVVAALVGRSGYYDFLDDAPS